MDKVIWKLFMKTGNIETYLLLKYLENEQPKMKALKREEVATYETKM